MHYASFVVQSSIGKYFAQALQHKAVLKGIWFRLCSTSVKCEVPGVQCEVRNVKCEVQSVEWRVWSVKCGV